MGDEDWQCGDCGTLIDGPETRKCPNCGGINFYPLVDEVPGDDQGTMQVNIDVEQALDRLSDDDAG
jgi:predicted  nucleic acid-binding Zn-ribbon protein